MCSACLSTVLWSRNMCTCSVYYIRYTLYLYSLSVSVSLFLSLFSLSLSLCLSVCLSVSLSCCIPYTYTHVHTGTRVALPKLAKSTLAWSRFVPEIGYHETVQVHISEFVLVHQSTLIKTLRFQNFLSSWQGLWHSIAMEACVREYCWEYFNHITETSEFPFQMAGPLALYSYGDVCVREYYWEYFNQKTEISEFLTISFSDGGPVGTL